MQFRTLITEITLTNFESHKDTTVRPAEGLTVVAGPGNSGKSSILRAVAWALFGVNGADHIRHGEKTSKVKITFSNGMELEKQRTKTTISYRFRGEDGIEHISQGDQLPGAWAQDMQLYPIQLGSEEGFPQLHSELSSPFLILDTPKEAERKLYYLLGIEALEQTLSTVTQELDTQTKEKKRCADDLAACEERLSHLAKLEDWIATVETYRQATTDLNSLMDKKHQYASLQEQLTAITANLEHLRALRSQIKEALTIEQQLEEVNKLKDRHTALVNLQSKLNQTKLQTASLRQELKQTVAKLQDTKDTIQNLLIELGICPLCGQTTNREPSGQVQPAPSSPPSESPFRPEAGRQDEPQVVWMKKP